MNRWSVLFVAVVVLVSVLSVSVATLGQGSTELDRVELQEARRAAALAPHPEVISVVPVEEWTRECAGGLLLDLWWPSRDPAVEHTDTHMHLAEWRGMTTQVDGGTWVTWCGDPEGPGG